MEYIAYVVSQTETDYTVLSSHDKVYHTMPLPIVFGECGLPDGTKLLIQEHVFNPSKILTACKEYDSHLKRKKSRYQLSKSKIARNQQLQVSIPLVSPHQVN